MSRRSRAIPNEPAHTCPLIDTLINQLENTVEDPDHLTWFKAQCERIRSANVTLREWGSAIADLYTSLEEDHESQDSKLREAKDTIDDLEREVASLKKENDHLQLQMDATQ